MIIISPYSSWSLTPNIQLNKITLQHFLEAIKLHGKRVTEKIHVTVRSYDWILLHAKYSLHIENKLKERKRAYMSLLLGLSLFCEGGSFPFCTKEHLVTEALASAICKVWYHLNTSDFSLWFELTSLEALFSLCCATIQLPCWMSWEGEICATLNLVFWSWWLCVMTAPFFWKWCWASV